jgi:hypothetical protein
LRSSTSPTSSRRGSVIFFLSRYLPHPPKGTSHRAEKSPNDRAVGLSWEAARYRMPLPGAPRFKQGKWFGIRSCLYFYRAPTIKPCYSGIEKQRINKNLV